VHKALVTGAALAATTGTVLAGVVGVVALRSGQALPGTTVDGVDVGGLDAPAIERALSDLEAQRETGEILLLAAEARQRVLRQDLGVDLDLEATADRAISAGRDGAFGWLLGPLLGEEEREVDPVVTVDEGALDERLDALAVAVDREPSPGGFLVQGTQVTAGPPVPGRVLDRPEASEQVVEALEEGVDEPVELPLDTLEPPTTQAQVDRVVEQARTALAAPYSLTVGDEALTVTPEQLAPLIGAPYDDASLRFSVDAGRLRELVARKAAEIDRPARSASFAVSSGAQLTAQSDATWRPQPAQVSVQPGVVGREVDVDAATDRLVELVGTDQRTGELLVRETAPALTTEQAQAAGVTSTIGTFTTFFQAGQPRATNIRRIAEIVDGTYVAPGETFSLNQTAGRRTRARGFVADGTIVDGELVDEVGGGVSQFATTLFNAAFFAGLPILEHKPHSFYISRYPAGRESTVYFGAIDVKFRNNTGHGIVVGTSSTPSSVSVTLYGDNGGRTVRASHGPRRDTGDGGFRIAVTRTISGGDGRGDRRTFTTTYDPPPEE
jgi:vancomycin resistance protein YoaR